MNFSKSKKSTFWHISSYLGKDSNNIHSYSLSAAGKPCNNPIRSESQCRKAAEVLKLNTKVNGYKIETKFIQLSGSGYDLPNGCIAELICPIAAMDDMWPCPPGPRLVYWNPNGIGISNDIGVRTVCYNPEKSFDGTTDSVRNSRFIKSLNIVSAFVPLLDFLCPS